MRFTTIIVSTILACTASAHGGIKQYHIDGAWYEGSRQAPGRSIQREWIKYDPVRDPSNSALTCNTPGTPARLTAQVKAGSNITAYWNAWPHNSGPLLVWMTECPGDCSTFTNPQHADWFKIDQGGLISGTVGKGFWATTQMVRSNSSWSVRVPQTLKPGNYLIRHETINLARSPAEFYPECAQLSVIGSGATSPGKEFRAKIPGVWKANDPAFAHEYSAPQVASLTRYTLPGPEVWRG